MVSFLCFAHLCTSTQNVLGLPILACLNQAQFSGPSPNVRGLHTAFQHFPTSSYPSFELHQHFNHVPKIALITTHYIFLALQTRVFKLSTPDFWRLYNYFLLELSCAVAPSRASTPWMPVALSLHYDNEICL